MPVSPSPPWAQRRLRGKASPRPLSAVPLIRSPLTHMTQSPTPVPPSGGKGRSRSGLPFDRALSVDVCHNGSGLDRDERRPSAGGLAGRPLSARTPHTVPSPFETPQRPSSAWRARGSGAAASSAPGMRPHSAHVSRSGLEEGLSRHGSTPQTAPAQARDRPRQRPHTAKERVKKELFPAAPSRPQSSKIPQRPRTVGKTPMPDSEPLHRLPSAPSKDPFFRDPPSLPGRRIMRKMEGQEMELWKTFRSCSGTRQNHADFDSWIEGVEVGLSHIAAKRPHNVTSHLLDATEKEKFVEEQWVLAKEKEQALEQEEAEELQRLNAEATEREKQVLRGLHNGEWLGEQEEEEEEIDLEALMVEQEFTGFLLECPISRELEYEQLQELAKGMDKKSFNKGKVILSQGDPLTDKFYIIKEGAALVYWTDEQGRRHKCATLRRCTDFGLGEISICPPSSEGFNADIVADSAVMLFAIKRLPFMAECEALEAAHGTCMSPCDDYLHQLEFDMGAQAAQLQGLSINKSFKLGPAADRAMAREKVAPIAAQEPESCADGGGGRRAARDSGSAPGLASLRDAGLEEGGAGGAAEGAGGGVGRSLSAGEEVVDKQLTDCPVTFSGDREVQGLGEREAQPLERIAPPTAAGRDADEGDRIGRSGSEAGAREKAPKERPAALGMGISQLVGSRSAAVPDIEEIVWQRPEQHDDEDYEAFSKRAHSSVETEDVSSADSILDAISKCKVFEYMTKNQRRRMLSRLDYEVFAEGQYVVKQGNKEGRFMFIVFSGTLECSKVSRKGVKRVLRTYAPGEYFGEIALLRQQPRAANVAALEPCRLICVSGRMLDDAQLLTHARNRLEKLLENYYSPNLRALFLAFDDNNDGLLQSHEARKMLQVLGYEYSDSEFAKGFAKLETSWQGEIDFDDFLEFWEAANYFDPLGVKERSIVKSKHDLMLLPEGVKYEEEELVEYADADQEFEDEVLSLQTRAAEEARSFWRTYDTDGSGTMDKDELMEMLEDLGFDDCSEERVEREMRLMDTQGKGEVELEDFTDWWIMLQTQIFTHSRNQLLLPLESIKAVAVHHPTVFLSLERSQRIFQTIDADQDGFIKPEDLLNSIMEKKTRTTVNKLGVALGYAEKEGDPLDRENFDGMFQQMDSLELQRIDVDQFVGYFGPPKEEGEEEEPESMKSKSQSMDEGKTWIVGKGFQGSNRANSFDADEVDAEPGSNEGKAGEGKDGADVDSAGSISKENITRAVEKFRVATKFIGSASDFSNSGRLQRVSSGAEPPARTKEQAIWSHLTKQRTLRRIESSPTGAVSTTKKDLDLETRACSESAIPSSPTAMGAEIEPSTTPKGGAGQVPLQGTQSPIPGSGPGAGLQHLPVLEESSRNIFEDLDKGYSNKRLGKHNKNSELELLELPKKGKAKMVSRAVPAPVSNNAPNELIDACVKAFSEHEWETLMDLLKRGVSMAKNDIFARALLGEDNFFLRILTAVISSQGKELKLQSLELLRVLVYCPKLVQQHMPNGNNILAQEVAAQTMIEIVGNEEEAPEVRRAAAHVLHGCVDVHENNTLFLMESEIRNAKEQCWWRSSFFGEGDEADEMRIDTVQLPPRAKASISLCFQKLEPPVMPPIKRRQRHKKKAGDSESDRDDMSETSSMGRSGSVWSDGALRRSPSNSGDWESEISEGTEQWSDIQEGDEEGAQERRRARTRDPSLPEREVKPEMNQEEFSASIREGREEKLDEFLRSVPLFQVLTEREDRDTLARELTVRVFSNGECLLKQGEQHGDIFFVIYNGTVVERKVGKNGEELQSREFGPGEVVGDDALLEETAQEASVYAKGTCLVFAFAVEQLFFIRDKIKALYQGTRSLKLKSSLSFRVEAKNTTNTNMKLFVQAVDHDGNGEISENELLVLMRKLGAECPEAEIERVFEEMDNDGDGKIDYEEFERWWDSVNYFDIMGVQTYNDEEDSEWYDRARVKKAWDTVLAEKARARSRNSANLIGDNRSVSLGRGMAASPISSRRRASVVDPNATASPHSSPQNRRRASVVNSMVSPQRRRGSVADGTPMSSRRRGSVAVDSFVTPQRLRRMSMDIASTRAHAGDDLGRHLLVQAALRRSSLANDGWSPRETPPLRAASSPRPISAVPSSADSDPEAGNGSGSPLRRSNLDEIPDGFVSFDPVNVSVGRPPPAGHLSPPRAKVSPPKRKTISFDVVQPVSLSPMSAVRRDALFQSSFTEKILNSKLMLHDAQAEGIEEELEKKRKQARAAKKIAKSNLTRGAFASRMAKGFGRSSGAFASPGPTTGRGIESKEPT